VPCTSSRAFVAAERAAVLDETGLDSWGTAQRLRGQQDNSGLQCSGTKVVKTSAHQEGPTEPH
jgi:hypothetical protein